jgi:glycosyltransferase involved in cell wall biosynthesis
MQFSIITPTYNYDEKRAKDLARCINSIQNQSFTDAEHIIIDQTEKDEYKFLFDNSSSNTAIAIKYFEQTHVERLFAVRKGFEEAKGEWFCLVDSDDIYLPHYLEAVNQMIEENPDFKLFNFGNIYVHKDGRVTSRDEFRPKNLEIGHEVFNGGTIVNGTYVFHRSLWEEMGDWPKIEKLWNPWDFSIAAQEEFPELKQFFVVDHPEHPEGYPKELGNPWGQDFYLFYKYTRKYHSIPINKHLLGVYAK